MTIISILLVISIWLNVYAFYRYIKEKNMRIYLQNLCRESNSKLGVIKAKQEMMEQEVGRIKELYQNKKG